MVEFKAAVKNLNILNKLSKHITKMNLITQNHLFVTKRSGTGRIKVVVTHGNEKKCEENNKELEHFGDEVE